MSSSMTSPIQNYLTSGNQIWTADIYKEQKKHEQSNFSLSPFAAQVVLALTQSGARDMTAQEIQTKMHLPQDAQTIRNGVGAWFDLLKSYHYQMDTASKIYVKDSLPIKNEFKQVANSEFKAEAENIDFSQTREAANTINQWVEKQTRNSIHNIIGDYQISSDMGAVIISALSFRGRWESEFTKDETKNEDFYKNRNEVVKVPMMHMQGKFQLCDSKELQAKLLEVSYRGGAVSMVVVLPNDKTGLNSLEEKADKVFSKHEFVGHFVNVTLPKFNIESSTDFKRILTQRGISKIFSEEADLSGIAGNKGELRVGLVLQKTSVCIDEEGTQVGSTTDIGPRRGASLVKSSPKEFVVDHPFMFYIVANEMILYAGRVSDPSK